MIWLDGLDLPMYQAIPVNFAQGYKEHRYPSMETPESLHKIPWGPVLAALSEIPGPYARYQYLLPNGRPLSAIIGAEAERLDGGSKAPRRRETASFVYHIVEGQGYTEFDDGERIGWNDLTLFVSLLGKRIDMSTPAWRRYIYSVSPTVHYWKTWGCLEEKRTLRL